MEFEQLLAKIAKVLETLNIPYCVTGGYAVSVWGRPRATFDIDVVIQLTTENIGALLAELRKLSEAGYVAEATVLDAVRRGKEFNFFHPETGIKVDFWVVKPDSRTGRNEIENRIAQMIGRQAIYFVSPEDLILAKLRWHKESGSERQLEDIESVLRIQKKIDIAYLKKWAVKQSTIKTLESLMKKNISK